MGADVYTSVGVNIHMEVHVEEGRSKEISPERKFSALGHYN